MWRHSTVCVGPGRKPRNLRVSYDAAHLISDHLDITIVVHKDTEILNTCTMLTCPCKVDPLLLTFIYSKIWVCRGLHYFVTFVLKHTLLIFIRTASSRNNMKYIKKNHRKVIIQVFEAFQIAAIAYACLGVWVM